MEQLLGSCAGYEELVSDEFIARIGAMTGSADPVMRRNGLRFLFDLGTREMANSLDEFGTVGAKAAAYWGQWSAAQAEAHLADIMTEAADDSWLRIAALTYGLLSADQALAMPGGLSVLIGHLPRETGELERASYLVQMGWRILNDRSSADVLDSTAAAARSRPSPRWVGTYSVNPRRGSPLQPEVSMRLSDGLWTPQTRPSVRTTSPTSESRRRCSPPRRRGTSSCWYRMENLPRPARSGC